MPGERRATGAIKGISATRALASFRVAREVSIAPIAVSTCPLIGKIKVSSWIAPIGQPNGGTTRVKEAIALTDRSVEASGRDQID